MTDVADLPPLTTGFGHATRDDWVALVAKALKGADFNRRLVAKTHDGLAIEPLYDRASGAEAVTGGTAGRPWAILARVDHPDPAVAAELALADLTGGANGLSLAVAGSPVARGFGVAIDTDRDMAACLDGVLLDLIHVRFEPHAEPAASARRFAALCARRGHDATRLNVSFGFDPIGTHSASRDKQTWPETGRQLATSIGELRADGFAGPFITCDGRPASEAGASDAQELAWLLASGVAYGRALCAHGFTVADAYGCLSWTLAIDADQFLGIAKLRALRRLWRRVEAASGVAARPMPIHGETAWRMLTQRDTAVNLLRSTMAAFVAGVGGADSVTLLPHTSALGLPDALGRRIARNSQLVLQDEAHLWRVADPAAGAGAFEALTEALCEAAWRQFQEIEREGGLPQSLSDNHFSQRIAITAATRRKEIATRRAPITGTSEFPNLVESGGGILDVAPQAAAATVLPSVRFAAPFEALRDVADAATAAHGTRPRVFLANLGTLVEFASRATWTGNLLAAGGIGVIAGEGFTASGHAAAVFADSGAAVACICGTDETYGHLAEATAMALKSAGATHVLLAGNPGALDAALRAAGVDQFLFAGQDMVQALGQLQAALGITPA